MRLLVSDLQLLCKEFEHYCGRARLQKTWDGQAGEVVLRFRGQGNTAFMLIAVGHQYARIHLTENRPKAPDSPTPFVGLLRKHLQGLFLSSVEILNEDRIVKLAFRSQHHGDQLFSLVAEITDRHGNLFLVDHNDILLGSLRPNVSHRRELTRGNPYVLPRRPLQNGGMSQPLLNKEGDESPSLQLEQLADRKIASTQQQALQQRAKQILRREIKRLSRRLSHITADLEQAEAAPEKTKWAQLLQSAYGQIEKGAQEVEVIDYFDSNLTPVRIPLNPALSLNDNIAYYFKQSRRKKAAITQIKERLHTVEMKHQLLTKIYDDAKSQEKTPDIESLIRKGLVRRPQKVARKEKKEAHTPFRRFTSSTGKQILVGRSAKENDTLTFRVGRGRDLWLHVDGSPGAHVLIKLQKGVPPDQETLLDGATLAAFYSHLRKETIVDVRYARQCDLRKAKGAPAGQVNVLRSKNLAVRMEPSRIKRLFADSDGNTSSSN